ncbi:hypothetical protein Tco_0749408 [Tanacetum coccineum]|uniref:Uncharacterized protein n=1 Tax=Tanacetum coccineum TaxID=301880 RepID=A0ABQ4Z137_9ASTR
MINAYRGLSVDHLMSRKGGHMAIPPWLVWDSVFRVFQCRMSDVVEDMDPYLDEGIGDVVVGEPFCKVSCVEARRFDGIITIRDEGDSVTYQMVCSNPRFKHLTNKQCNKISPLLKVRKQDKMNRISHPYQEAEGFPQRSFESRTRLYPICEDGRMAHMRAH